MLFILYGEDDYSLREALAETKGGLGDEAMIATNTTVLQAQSTTPEEVKATCDTIPFLAPKRLVIVEGLLGLFDQQGRAKPSPKPRGSGWLSLQEYVGQMPESTVLVLIDGKLREGNPLLKGLSSGATVRGFPSQKGAKLHEWVRRRAQKCGGSISSPAARLLADLVGSNLWILSNEIEKLFLYAGERTVEENDVRLLVGEAREFSVFEMVDAILERKSPAATKLLHRLEDEGAAPPFLLFMITRQFRFVLQTKDLLQRKHKPYDIGRSLGIASQYALGKTTNQARAYSMARLEKVYRRLLDTDISIKTGKLKGELALDLLVVELCE